MLYSVFQSRKQLGIFLLSPGWNANPSQGYPPEFDSPLDTWVEEGIVRVKCLA